MIAIPNLSSMHVGIISECAMSHGHGTGVQMLRTFHEGGSSYTHFYFSHHYAGFSEVPNSHLLDESLPFGITGKRTVSKWLRRAGINWTWWNGDRLNSKKFRYLLSQKGIKCDVMYVLVATESHASRALEILRQIKCPYVVHIMDLYDAEGIVPETMPAMRELLASASSVLVLTQSIAEEVRRVRNDGVTLIPIGIDPPQRAHTASPPHDGELRIALTGRIYEGIGLLAEAHDAIRARWPKIKILYCGNHYQRIPESLRSIVQFPGWLSKEQVRAQILSCHVAYLCGPYKLDGLGKFSFPSRVSDYFVAGLPVVSAAGQGTAAREMLAPLEGECVRAVAAAQDIPDAIGCFVDSPQAWRNASSCATRFAESNLRIDAIREVILGTLRNALSINPAALTSGV